MSAATKLLAKTIFDYPISYSINVNSFTLAGLGKQGPLCGVNRISHFSAKGDAVKYSPLSCKKIECPKCWPDWAKHAVFELAMKIEAWAHATKTRPYSCVFSVSPEKVKTWTWERVNMSLFRRGYRRAKNHAGIEGGVAIFHPYRIKKKWKKYFRRAGESQVGMWKLIRARVRAGASLYDYVDLGPHVHSIVFGNPKAHSSKDFLLAFKDDDEGAVQLKDYRAVVAFLFYLLSHTGVLTQLRSYASGVHVRRIHCIRTYGKLHNLDPLTWLFPEEWARLAKKIAAAMKMEFHNGQLSYPASPQGFETSDPHDWVPIYELYDYLKSDAWVSSLNPEQLRYFSVLAQYMTLNDRPPEPGELTPPPSVVEEFAEVHEDGDL